jgi:hypothetical protein
LKSGGLMPIWRNSHSKSWTQIGKKMPGIHRNEADKHSKLQHFVPFLSTMEGTQVTTNG